MSKRALTAAVLTAAGLATQASAQNIDVSIAGVQTLQNVQAPGIKMTAGKSTAVRVGLLTTGTPAPGEEVDAILRVFVDGVETADSPIYSVNGPIVPPAASNILDADQSINFQFIPPGGNVELRVEVNPAGPNQVPETDFSNNTAVVPEQVFFCRKAAELIYVPIDYRPGGGATPNLPNPLLIEPGVGDGFVQAIYPGPDFEYRIYDQGSKLWTNSLSGSGSALNNSLTNELQLMNPKPEFMYGWVPGGLPYNGQTNFTTAMGNTQPIKHQRTHAHEMGHILGKNHTNATISTIGFDVEHHLNITQALPQVMPGSKKDIMAAGLNTVDAWVWPNNYDDFYENSKFQCVAPDALDAVAGETIYFSGIFDRATGAFELGTMMAIENLRPMPSVPADAGDLVFEVLGKDGQSVLARTGFSWEFHCFGDVAVETDTLVAVAATLPQTVLPRDVGSVRILDREGALVDTIARTDNAPVVTIDSPRPSQLIPDTFTFEWTASDADGDALNQHLRYSPDGQRFVPLGTELTGGSFEVDMRRLPRMQTGKGYFELIVSDGLNTTVARTAKLRPTIQFASFVGGLPTTHILTPDDGKVYPKGAEVILHSSGWDLEDRGLTGSDVVWTSDLDGFLTTGRVTAVDDLSVGTHVLTVTVTDTDNQTASDSHVVTILDRPLPGGATTCQTDLGFGGPGGATLAICGGDLSTGTFVDVSVTGATPSAPLWLAVGTGINPVPFLGGTAVPATVNLILPGMTDAGGDFVYAGFPGGGGPTTFVVQAVYLDGAQTAGVGITNAVQADILP